MSNLAKLLFAFLAGILLSACRATPPEPEEPPVPPQPPVDEDTDTDTDTDEEEPEPPVDEEEEPEPPVVDDEEEAEIDQELETIDSLEIDPYWGTMLEVDTESVLERLVTTCIVLDENSVTDIVLDMMNDGIPQLSAEHMVETAVFIVCPEYIPDYESYILQQRNM